MFLVKILFFFFQAEDGIRDIGVTGVQTCALPISVRSLAEFLHVRCLQCMLGVTQMDFKHSEAGGSFRQWNIDTLLKSNECM